jgi:hypothetical protein
MRVQQGRPCVPCAPLTTGCWQHLHGRTFVPCTCPGAMRVRDCPGCQPQLRSVTLRGRHRVGRACIQFGGCVHTARVHGVVAACACARVWWQAWRGGCICPAHLLWQPGGVGRSEGLSWRAEVAAAQLLCAHRAGPVCFVVYFRNLGGASSHPLLQTFVVLCCTNILLHHTDQQANLLNVSHAGLGGVQLCWQPGEVASMCEAAGLSLPLAASSGHWCPAITASHSSLPLFAAAAARAARGHECVWVGAVPCGFRDNTPPCQHQGPGCRIGACAHATCKYLVHMRAGCTTPLLGQHYRIDFGGFGDCLASILFAVFCRRCCRGVWCVRGRHGDGGRVPACLMFSLSCCNQDLIQFLGWGGWGRRRWHRAQHAPSTYRHTWAQPAAVRHPPLLNGCGSRRSPPPLPGCAHPPSAQSCAAQ